MIEPITFHPPASQVCFRALDRGQTTALGAYEITGASFWEVLEWAESPRDPSPSFSELYACSPDLLNAGEWISFFLDRWCGVMIQEC